MPNVIPVERYECAAAFAPAKLARRLSGSLEDGYWIDNRRFFYTVSRVAPDGRQALHPMIVDALEGIVSPVLAPERLASLLSEHSEREVKPSDLAEAQYEMPNAATLVVMLSGTAYHVALEKPAIARAEPLDTTPALHAPDGKRACFLKEHAVWVKDCATATAKPLTGEGEALFAFGRAPESGLAAVFNRKHPMPLGLWSADSQWFVTHRIDERRLPELGLIEHAPAGGGRPVLHRFKTAVPDETPASVEFTAIHGPSGRTLSTAQRPINQQVFSPFVLRSCWFSGEGLYFLDFDRFSSEVSLLEMDLTSGALRTVLTEKAARGWLELHPLIVGQPIVRIVRASNEVIWFSERDGFSHLYLYDLRTGALKDRITRGDWMVRDIVYVDEAKRRILFLASGLDPASDPAHRKLCAIHFDGSGFETLLSLNCDIAVRPDPASANDQLKPFRPSYAPVGVSADGRYAVARLTGAAQATRSVLFELATGRQVPLAEVAIEAQWPAPRPRPFEVLAADGVTKLFGEMYLPSDFDETKSYPLIDYIYPGPQVNWFFRRFPNTTGAALQSVVELGMVGIILETRGMPMRNRAFQQIGQGSLHEPQLSDHVAAIEQLCARHRYLDRDRVGIFGQSGGGYATARALFDHPEVFKAGVAVCGNHDSRTYTGYWLNKYGGRPGTPERDLQANSTVAHRLKGKLLLVSGDMDENVHVGQTLALSAALIEAGRDFDHLIVPGAGHGVLFESAYALRRLWDFFVRHLLGAEPPADFVLRYRPDEVAAGARMGSAERKD